MKKIHIALMLAGCIAFSPLTHAKGNWEKVTGRIPSQHQQARFPKHYQGYYLDQNAMKSILAKATLDPENPVMIDLPDAENNFKTFRLWETPILTKEAQTKYPNLKTYTAVDITNEAITAKISYTSFGFRAMVFTPENSYFIAPYSKYNDGYYLVFNQKDYVTPSMLVPCDVTTEDQMTHGNPTVLQPEKTHIGGTANRSNGFVKHIYRCAIACTGEWAQQTLPGQSKDQIVEFMGAMLNNANGVFERELSVSMVLIPEEDQVLYLDPNTDPFTADGPNDQLLGENQTNFDQVFPTGAEYDIAHILNTAGGGVAMLTSICQMGAKASGVSSCGDIEDVHVIVHEMGHQMGSTHTFNSDQGGCNGQRSAESGYETGSGTSIMSYNGLCDPDNVPGFSFDYYHVYTLDVITQNLSSINCGIDSPGSLPIIIPNLTDKYIIPKNTPFELICTEAEASENNPSVTYSWEQWDLKGEPANESASASWDSGPIMQSFPPSNNIWRTFPSMDVLLAGNYATVGQRLPTVEREMNYRVTARSYKNGWGTYCSTDSATHIKVADQPEFRVTSPDATATWDTGTSQTITWTVGGTASDPILCNYVDIYISYDGGYTFPHRVVNDAPNNGSCTFDVPNVYSDSVRFKVKGEGNVFFDISKANIQIHGDPLATKDIDANNLFAIFPNPATGMVYIENKSQHASTLQLELYNVLGQRVWQGSMKNKTQVDVSNLSRGNYFFRIADDGKVYTKKVVLK